MQKRGKNNWMKKIRNSSSRWFILLRQCSSYHFKVIQCLYVLWRWHWLFLETKTAKIIIGILTNLAYISKNDENRLILTWYSKKCLLHNVFHNSLHFFGMLNIDQSLDVGLAARWRDGWCTWSLRDNQVNFYITYAFHCSQPSVWRNMLPVRNTFGR